MARFRAASAAALTTMLSHLPCARSWRARRRKTRNEAPLTSARPSAAMHTRRRWDTELTQARAMSDHSTGTSQPSQPHRAQQIQRVSEHGRCRAGCGAGEESRLHVGATTSGHCIIGRCLLEEAKNRGLEDVEGVVAHPCLRAREHETIEARYLCYFRACRLAMGSRTGVWHHTHHHRHVASIQAVYS
eukprot:SAG25_NODE_4432_length_816_cov_0.747559_1_plen_188_part_00